MVEIRIILSETEYERALEVKGSLVWRDVLLKALGLEAERRRCRGRPKVSKREKI